MTFKEILTDLYSRITSRKFLLALGGIIAILAKIRGQGFIGQDDINAIIAIILGYNAMEGLADGMERYGAAKSDIKVSTADTVNVDQTKVSDPSVSYPIPKDK